MSSTWSQALAWRMRRQFLDPAQADSVTAVVERLGGVPAADLGAAGLALRLRCAQSRPDDLERALARGELVRTFAFRGATHLLGARQGGAYLALRAASRMWERPGWRSHYGLEPDDWPHLREATRTALADGPLTERELVAALVAVPRLAHLAPVLADGAWTLLKPLAWQGVLCFGPPRSGRTTFTALDTVPTWGGIPDLEVAGPWAVECYLRAYGPTSPDRVHHWLGEGLGAGRARIRSWWAGLGERLVGLDIEGERVHVLAEDLDELRATRAGDVVRLLPGHDQWVLGPGTGDTRVVPSAARTAVTRGRDVVLLGGVVVGTWALGREEVAVAALPGLPQPPREALAAEVTRLAGLVGRPLRPVLTGGPG